MEVIIEEQAGFCKGVVSAIKTCEEHLKSEGSLYCIGDIVHNSEEVERLRKAGLKIIEVEDLEKLSNCTVMIRAHGEPPSTYALAQRNNIKIVDATCPTVLKLQRDVRKGYEKMRECNGQIVLFGKRGHAEVVGLEGQTDNTAIVVSKVEDLKEIDFCRPVHIFSQTTKSKEEYFQIVETIRGEMRAQSNEENFFDVNSICPKVSSRSKNLLEFADSVDAVLFVSGKHSSNGTYLYQLCKEHKQETFFVSQKEDICLSDLKQYRRIGISGATSTPMWLMEQIRDYVFEAFKDSEL